MADFGIGGYMRASFVEDSLVLQQTVGTALRWCGYAVDVSGDGEDGLWRAENTDYDVIVLDLMLPKLDGLSVLQRLREAGRHACAPPNRARLRCL